MVRFKFSVLINIFTGSSERADSFFVYNTLGIFKGNKEQLPSITIRQINHFPSF